MKVWVLNKHFGLVYLLDKSNFVWDFDMDSVDVLALFIEVVGHIAPGVVVSAVREYNSVTGKAWPYLLFDQDEIMYANSGYLTTWQRKGYIVGEDLKLYNPNLLLVNHVYGLLSEHGDILRLEPVSFECLDIDKLHRDLVGCIVGSSYALVLSEQTIIRHTCNLYLSSGQISVYMDYHGNDKAYNLAVRRLYDNTPSGVHLDFSRWS